MVLTLVTSLDEMDVLGRAGQYGWHCVGGDPSAQDIIHNINLLR